ncbi:MAG: hypothetical protein K0Q83_656 [Deltaproteobacteria bacterium]|jgi:hypothetical protein|nr:hypothetical protein [Deltaproteobacteria bacterium]
MATIEVCRSRRITVAASADSVQGVMLIIGCGFYVRLEADRAPYIEASLKRIDVSERTGRACPGAVNLFV